MLWPALQENKVQTNAPGGVGDWHGSPAVLFPLGNFGVAVAESVKFEFRRCGADKKGMQGGDCERGFGRVSMMKLLIECSGTASDCD